MNNTVIGNFFTKIFTWVSTTCEAIGAFFTACYNQACEEPLLALIAGILLIFLAEKCVENLRVNSRKGAQMIAKTIERAKAKNKRTIEGLKDLTDTATKQVR